MRIFLFMTVLLMANFRPVIFSQTPVAPKLYSHKVTVVEILQTKAYTYLYVKECIKENDSLQWLALPLFNPQVGNVYYFESGLQMGEFHSRELDKTFSKILFLANLGTTPEISEKNVVPVPVIDTVHAGSEAAEVHTVIVQEVLQTSGYTYLRVKEGDKEEWLAVVKINTKPGQSFTYDDAGLMKDFTSKELKRTFPEILFVANLKPAIPGGNGQGATKPAVVSGNSETKKSAGVKDEPAIGGVAISSLLENKNSYAGKKLRIKGTVTKYSGDILGKNWIHINDEAALSGKSDLTITTSQSAKVGDIITAEGIISVNKDFGSGYFFDVIMEEASIENK